MIGLYVPAEVMSASVFVALYTAELQGRAPLQAQSAIQLDRESSYKRLSQLALDLAASPASQAYVERLFSLCGDLTARNFTVLTSTQRSHNSRLVEHVPDKHLEYKNAESPPVNRLIVALVLDDFRRQVLGSTTQCPRSAKHTSRKPGLVMTRMCLC